MHPHDRRIGRRNGAQVSVQRIDAYQPDAFFIDEVTELDFGGVIERVLFGRPIRNWRELLGLDPVRDHPCDSATAASSSAVSESVTYRVRSPRSFAASRNCRASVVLPVPGTPSIRCMRRVGILRP